MHNLRHYLLFDPNMIIQLLHVCINSNFFKFGDLIFQQVQGTAMGAAFSPTIANIFMSVVLNKFLATQQHQPLLIKRYIDDLLILWQHGETSLQQFLAALNTFHPNLKFKFSYSKRTTDFLDLTIFKNRENQSNLDTTTFQKPQNSYQYLHYLSNHPNYVFKAIITGELIRYVRTNTTEAGYINVCKLFKERLLRRDYPIALIEKTFKTVSFSSRNFLLQQASKPVPRIKIPLFKLVPPPNFNVLKRIILTNYKSLKLPSPRFITIKQKALSNDLVRAQVFPTEEQLLDIVVKFSEVHTLSTAGSLPDIKPSTVRMTKCNHPKCTTCKHLDCSKYFVSSKTKKSFIIRHSFSCSSRYVVYLITCSKCSKQYVGYTTQHLHVRINHHRSNIFRKVKTYIANHFNFPDHDITNLRVQCIDKASTLEELKQQEHFWIRTLKTKEPFGLNVLP